jgi:twinkle protein
MKDRAWIERVKASIGIDRAVAALGLQRGRMGSFGPCPLCHADKRGSGDTRLPVGVGREKGRWHCWKCSEGGDVLDLVAAVRLGQRAEGLDAGRWQAVREACVAQGWVDPPEDSERAHGREAKPAAGRRIVTPGSALAAGRLRARREDPAGGDAEPAAPWDPALATTFAARLWTVDGTAALDYLRGVRGFSDETIRAWGLGAMTARDGTPWVSIPLSDASGVVQNIRYRSVPPPCSSRPGQSAGCDRCDACKVDRKARGYRVTKGRPLPLFGSHRLPSDLTTHIVVTEGELDVVALHEYGFTSGVVSGTGGAGTLKDEWLDELEPYQGFVIAYDGDEKGEEGANELAGRLGRYRCSRVVLPKKDAGECLSGGVTGDEIEAAINAARGMLATEIVGAGAYADEIERLIAHPEDLVGRSTGSPRFDQALGGIRPGLIVVSGETSHGKAQPLDEPVLTPTGWRSIGDLRVGDAVIGSAGMPVRVIGVFPQGRRSICVVHFDDGAEVRCDWDHLWSVNTDLRVWRSSPPVIRTARELASTTSARDRLRWRVPVVAPVQGERHDEGIDPYVLGVLIGDGSLTNGSSFTKGDVQLGELVRARLRPGYSLSTMVESSGAFRFRICIGKGRSNFYIDEIRRYGLDCLSIDKRIPGIWLRGSVDQRFGLLQGLLDTDGWVEQNGIRFGTSSSGLAADVEELVGSLGGVVSRSSKIPIYRYKGEKRAGERAYTLSICLPEPFRSAAFLLDRKRGALRPARSIPIRKIRSVVPNGDADCVCIAVDAPDQLYVTKGFVVTHNTTFLTWLMYEQSRAGVPSLLTSFEQSPLGTAQKLLRCEVGGDFRANTEAERRAAFVAIDSRPLYIIKHRGQMPFTELHDTIRYAVRRMGVRNVLIDHLGFVIDPECDDERREIQTVVRALSIIAEHEAVAIFLVCHPSNQHVVQNRRVSFSDLKGASAIRQDAHEVWIVERAKVTKDRPWPATWIHLDKIRSDFGASESKVLLAFDPLATSYADEWEFTPSGKRGVRVVAPDPKPARKLRRQKDAASAAAGDRDESDAAGS